MKNEILELLQENSKYTASDIATMLGLDIEAVQNAIIEMEKDQVICGYSALINWDKTDKKDIVTALIEVKVTPQRGEGFDRVAERIYKFNEVKAVYLMSGGFDFTVIIEGRTMKEVALSLDKSLHHWSQYSVRPLILYSKNIKTMGWCLKKVRKTKG